MNLLFLPADTPERTRVHRICQIGWAISLVLSAAAPIVRSATHNRASGPILVGACVVVMLICLISIRKDFRAVSMAITMSVAGIGIGAAVGFLTLAFASGRGMLYVMALMWEGGGIYSTWLLLKMMRQAEWVPPPPPTTYEGSCAQYDAVMKEAKELMERMDAQNRRGKKALLIGGLTLVVLAVLGKIFER